MPTVLRWQFPSNTRCSAVRLLRSTFHVAKKAPTTIKKNTQLQRCRLTRCVCDATPAAAQSEGRAAAWRHTSSPAYLQRSSGRQQIPAVLIIYHCVQRERPRGLTAAPPGVCCSLFGCVFPSFFKTDSLGCRAPCLQNLCLLLMPARERPGRAEAHTEPGDGKATLANGPQAPFFCVSRLLFASDKV